MKFDPKKYQGKKRVQRACPGSHGVSRLYAWNSVKKCYEVPPRGKTYLARKWGFDAAGTRVRTPGRFETLAEARAWLSGQVEEPIQGGLVFTQVVAEWRRDRLPLTAATTQIHYEKMLRLYFQSLMSVPMKSFTAGVVDQWLRMLKDPDSVTMASKRRVNFRHELSLLSGILRYYREYKDNAFVPPILGRHKDDVKTGRKKRRAKKDLSLEEFLRFREKLRALKHGPVLASLATVQYFQALRVSEAAAIHWEDVSIFPEALPDSRLSITRSVIWPRVRGTTSYVQRGFKNAEANDGEKQQPLFPESYYALISLEGFGTGRGLAFKDGENHFEYRQLEYAYNTAFKLAGLPYSGTHIMRHGGTRLAYNATKDLDLAAQLLGNRDPKTVAVYAKRDASALTAYSKERWEKEASVAANACNS